MSKTSRWAAIRRELKADFERQGIVSCERCGSTFALSLAHRMKRRLITDDDELRRVALLCQACHHFIEYGDRDNPGTHERMFELVTGIIESRD